MKTMARRDEFLLIKNVTCFSRLFLLGLQLLLMHRLVLTREAAPDLLVIKMVWIDVNLIKVPNLNRWQAVILGFLHSINFHVTTTSVCTSRFNILISKLKKVSNWALIAMIRRIRWHLWIQLLKLIIASMEILLLLLGRRHLNNYTHWCLGMFSSRYRTKFKIINFKINMLSLRWFHKWVNLIMIFRIWMMLKITIRL